jgi:hypothetical protein
MGGVSFDWTENDEPSDCTSVLVTFGAKHVSIHRCADVVRLMPLHLVLVFRLARFDQRNSRGIRIVFSFLVVPKLSIRVYKDRYITSSRGPVEALSDDDLHERVHTVLFFSHDAPTENGLSSCTRSLARWESQGASSWLFFSLLQTSGRAYQSPFLYVRAGHSRSPRGGVFDRRSIRAPCARNSRLFRGNTSAVKTACECMQSNQTYAVNPLFLRFVPPLSSIRLHDLSCLLVEASILPRKRTQYQHSRASLRYLSVYVPPQCTAKTPCPVMNWIYGGAWSIGSDEEFGLYRGVNLAMAQGVVVVVRSISAPFFVVICTPIA